MEFLPTNHSIHRLLQVTAIVSNLDQVVHWYIQGGSKAGSSWHLDNQSTFQQHLRREFSDVKQIVLFFDEAPLDDPVMICS
jgi:hypothetical protein